MEDRTTAEMIVLMELKRSLDWARDEQALHFKMMTLNFERLSNLLSAVYFIVLAIIAVLVAWVASGVIKIF